MRDLPNAMTVRRPTPGLADYLAMAVGPVLIMIWVGSFAFFLLDLFYRGEHLLRVRWTLFWFVLASVLVSRISIEIDFVRASVFGFALAGATSLMLMRYVDFLPAVLVLLALIWWLAHRLTCNCTVIDDDTEGSEGGLLGEAGPGRRAVGARSEQRDTTPQSVARSPAAVASKLKATGAGAVSRPDRTRVPASPPPHAPGVWIVYASLFTLPVFALGEAILPRQDAAARAGALDWLRLHLTTAVGLLLVTSFLSLRRHLRRRYLEMPPKVFFRWSACGGVLAAGLLAAAAVLPRPSAYVHAPGLAGSLQAPITQSVESRQQASEDPRAGNAPAADSRRGTRAEPARDQSVPPGSAGASRQPGASQQASPTGTGTTASSGPAASPSAWRLVRTLAQLALALGAVGLAMRFRNELWRGLLELLESLRRLLGGASPRSSLPHRSTGDGAARNAPRPSAPFATGIADGWTVQRVVQETFHRFRARDLERTGASRSEAQEETPWEFAERVAAAEPELAPDLWPVARAYVGLAYGGRQPDERIRDHCVALWSRMQS